MASKATPLTESLEDYLEAVFRLENENGAVRATDIARSLRVKAPSVTGALRVLSDKGLVHYSPYGVIALTVAGKRLAKNVAARHKAFKDFLANVLCVEEKEAEEYACKLEHAVSPEILSRLRHFLHFLEECPLGGENWIKKFQSFCESGEPGANCETCMTESLSRFKKSRKNPKKIQTVVEEPIS